MQSNRSQNREEVPTFFLRLPILFFKVTLASSHTHPAACHPSFLFLSWPASPLFLDKAKAEAAVPSKGKQVCLNLSVASKGYKKCVCRLGGGLKQPTNLSHSTRNILNGFKSWNFFFHQLKFTSTIKFLCIYESPLSVSTLLEMGNVAMKERTTSNPYTPHPSGFQRRLKWDKLFRKRE